MFFMHGSGGGFQGQIRGCISVADPGFLERGCLPLTLVIFRVKRGKNEMDFLHNITTLLSLFMSKNNVTHLINQNLSLHRYILQTNDFSD